MNRLLELVAAGEHFVSYSDFRRFLTDRFSAQIFYEISDEELVIYGVFDCREAPEQIALDLSMR
ncbi:MAG: hypothetical protein KDN19_23770 [Verrucomicrobiae bacterium]|nr:hypothetical protein [Verrucomicrobiae bacterium]